MCVCREARVLPVTKTPGRCCITGSSTSSTDCGRGGQLVHSVSSYATSI